MKTLGQRLPLLVICLLGTWLYTGCAQVFPESRPTPTATVSETSKRSIVVGSKENTEQLLLQKILALALEDMGYHVVERAGLGGAHVLRDALEKEEIDLYWESTGSALMLFHEVEPQILSQGQNILADSATAYSMLQTLDKSNGLLWLEQLDFNASYVLLVPPAGPTAEIKALDGLSGFMKSNNRPLTLCTPIEFLVRPDGLFRLQADYDFHFTDQQIEVVEQATAYTYLHTGRCDVAVGIRTDAHIEAWGFRILEDTISFFPAYTPALVARKGLIDSYPELTELLSPIPAMLDYTTMSQLNGCVDLGPDGLPMTGDEYSIEQTVQNFLAYGHVHCPAVVVNANEGSSEQEPVVAAVNPTEPVVIEVEATLTPTATPIPVLTATPTTIPTNTSTQIPSQTPTQRPSSTPTQTSVSSPTATLRSKGTATDKTRFPIVTATIALKPTQTAIPTPRPTEVPIATSIPTVTEAPTIIPQPTVTLLPTAIPLPTETAIPVPQPELEQAARAANSSGTVQLIAPSTTGLIGRQITVPISVAQGPNSPGIRSYRFSITFDSQVLRFIDLSNSGTLSQNWGYSYGIPSPNTISVNEYGGPVITENGTIIKLIFQVVGAAGAESELILTNLILNDGALVGAVQNGYFVESSNQNN